jgi:hypothetical protein
MENLEFVLTLLKYMYVLTIPILKKGSIHGMNIIYDVAFTP